MPSHRTRPVKKTRLVNFSKLAAQEEPEFIRAATNMFLYGTSKAKLHQLIEQIDEEVLEARPDR